MALIACADCAKEHSDAAVACPNCGRPRVTDANAAMMHAANREMNSASGGFLRFLGWVWVICSLLGSIGLWLATADEKTQVENTRYYFQGGVEPTWLSSFGIAVGFAILIQGLTIGTFIITYARRERGR